MNDIEEKKWNRRSRTKWICFIIIPVLGCSIISLGGCTKNRITAPPKPTIESRDVGGMICLDRENFIRLGGYILALEAAVDQCR